MYRLQNGTRQCHADTPRDCVVRGVWGHGQHCTPLPLAHTPHVHNKSEGLEWRVRSE